MEAKVCVDQRVELISILFHMAGSPEYRRAAPTPYHDAVVAHFEPFRGHPAVAATQELRRLYGISHNAPIGLAVELDHESLDPKVSIAELKDDIDQRWRKVPVRAYLNQVRDFRAVSGFDEFFATQKEYIAAVEERLTRVIVEKRIIEWFDAWFGPLKGDVHLVPGLLTGPWNYEATATDGDGHHVYEVVELEAVDADGLPRPSMTTAEMIVHEMAHSYVNPLVEAHDEEFQVAVPLFERLRSAMAQQSYQTATVMVEESLVRAITILFVNERYGQDAARAQRAAEQKLGFEYIAALAAMLLNLSTQQKPLRLEAALPQVLEFFASLSRQAGATDSPAPAAVNAPVG